MHLFPAPDPENKTVQRIIMGTVSFASFLGALDMSIVNISVPTIVKAWHIPVGLGSMIILSYLLTLTCLIMIMGKLADRYGFRNLFISGFFVFGIGSFLCGCAPEIYSLLAARVVQAVGAAMLSAVAPAIIVRDLPESIRGRSLGYLISFSALGFAIGPGLGGLMSEYFSWRWIFLINLPIIVAGILLARYYLPQDTMVRKQKSTDLTSPATFVIFLAGILAAFSLFQVPGTPDSVLLLLFAIGVGAGLIFFYREQKSLDPLINPILLKNRNFSRGIIACFIVAALFSGVTYFMPLYLVNSRHLDSFLAGMIMMIPALISIIAAPVSGSLSDIYGSPIISALAIGLSTVGFLIIFTFSPVTTVFLILIGIIITRVSTAAFFGPNGSLIMGHCPPDALGNGAGIMMTIRYAGLVFGIALFQCIFALRMYAEGIPRDGTPLVPRLTPALSVLGYQAVYLGAFCLSLIVIVLVCYTKDAQKSD